MGLRAWIDRLRYRKADRDGTDDGHPVDPPAESLTPAAVRDITGQPVGDIDLYVQAMRHRSQLRGRPGSDIDSNERLEYLGDAVLGFVTAEYLYRKYPDEAEGFLTRLRSKLVNGKALAARARSIGLDRLLLISDNLRQQGQPQQMTSIMSDAFEALIGAIYLDHGMSGARAFIMRTMLEPLDLDALMQREDNPKSALLEFAQARGWSQPSYEVLEASGPSHKRHFTVQVQVQGEPGGIGEAGSKKQAEQRAAAEALRVLRKAEKME